MDKYENYVQWLRDNGCIFPSIEYPSYFGEFNIVGARANVPIPNKKAFLYVPNKLIITPHRARHSQIGEIIRTNLSIFHHSEDGEDNCLYLFLIYERLKGEESFWHPYFETVAGLDFLMFWDDLEILEDPELKLSTQVMHMKYESAWESFYEVLADHSDLFPADQATLKELFQWAFILVASRSFGRNIPCFMVIPLADNLNHANVDSKNHVLHKDLHLSDPNHNGFDFTDFGNEVGNTEGEMVNRTHGNSLENFLTCNELPEIAHVWDLDEHVGKYQSSDDDEDNGSDYDETECPDYSWYQWDNEEESYFIMSNNGRTAYNAGDEVTLSYGNRSNGFLLQNYGFVLEYNPYDSFEFRVLLPDVERNKEAIDWQKFEHISEATTKFRVKYARVNTKLMEHLRMVVLGTEDDEGDFESPLTLESEKLAVEQGLKIFEELGKRFITTIEDDMQLFNEDLPMREKYATIYRYNQKRIFKSQLDVLRNLHVIICGLQEGQDTIAGLNPHNWYRSRHYLKELYDLKA